MAIPTAWQILDHSRGSDAKHSRRGMERTSSTTGASYICPVRCMAMISVGREVAVAMGSDYEW